MVLIYYLNNNLVTEIHRKQISVTLSMLFAQMFKLET